MKIIVTGGAGFIGSHIVELLLNKGHEICVIDNLVHGKMEHVDKRVTFYKIDIRNERLLEIFEKERPDILVHHAAQIKVPNSISDPIYDASINIIGTLNLLECAKKVGVKKVIYPASAAMFGEPQYLPIDEDHPLNMISGYGVSKHTIEHYLRVYKELYDVDYVVLRYSNVYGPRQDSTGEGGVVAIFSEKMVRKEVPYIFGDGEQIRDFVYVKDIARANLIAIESDKCGIYNVCTNEKVTINNLVHHFNEILGSDIKPIYKSERDGDIKNSYMTYKKIECELGWKPEYDICKGLQETLEYYK